jgi:hypothetical protein
VDAARSQLNTFFGPLLLLRREHAEETRQTRRAVVVVRELKASLGEG